MENRENIIIKILKIMTENKVSFISVIISSISLILAVIGIVVAVNSSNRTSELEEIQNSIFKEAENEKTATDDDTTISIEEKTTDETTTAEKDTTDETTSEEKTTVNKTTSAETTARQEETTTKKNTSDQNTNAGGNSSVNTQPNGLIQKLHVDGTKLVNESGQTVVLNGVSTHGIVWFPQYINKEAFKTIRDSFGGNVIRIAMYSDPSAGYYEGLSDKVEEAVRYATELGMYVIIDWHILSDGNPNIYKSQAIKFFDKMSAKYKDYNNVLYEICNEPNGNITWANDVKPYAVDLIKTIRNNDPDGIILVGTTTWSQDVDIAADDPITGYSNIMYTCHFYAAAHKDWNRQKLEYALGKGLPVFVSEFSICDASGNGLNDVNSANQWMELLDRYNVSFVGWNLSNKAESSAIISSSCGKTSGWTDAELTESGRWLVKQLREH